MKRFVICLMIACLFFAGCTGSFRLTQNVHNFTRGQANEWLDEAVFLACFLIPAYEVAFIGDVVYFNSVEFWSGENPLIVVDVKAKGFSDRTDSNGIPDRKCTIEDLSSLDASGSGTALASQTDLSTWPEPEKIR